MSHSEIYHSKSGGMGPRRSQTSYIIPAWRKGDRVLHKPTGFYGQLTEMATAGGELWKLRVDRFDGVVPQGENGRRLYVQVHACDLELRT